MIEMIGSGSKDRDVNDYYATDPNALRALLEKVDIRGFKILEPCAGEDHLADVLREDNTVITNDLVQRSKRLDYNLDYLLYYHALKVHKFDMIITNPPFKYLQEFIDVGFELAPIQIIFARVNILEGVKRYEQLLSKGHLKYIYIFYNRVSTYKNGGYEGSKNANSMTFGWFIFDKNYNGRPTVDWLRCGST